MGNKNRQKKRLAKQRLTSGTANLTRSAPSSRRPAASSSVPANPQTHGDFWHGTTTSVLSADPDFVLAPARVHGSAQVWTPDTSVSADPAALHVGDSVALMFALVASQRLGGQPALAVVRLPGADLEPDPTYLDLIPADAGHRDWRSSYIACGRVVYRGTAKPLSRWRCDDVPKLAQRLRDTGLSTQLTEWANPFAWKPYAERLGLGPQVDSPLAFRDVVGKSIFRDCFVQF
ncbi:MAG: hypothetical protein U0S48_18205 [Solirubrobacteraceae bacterium]